MATITYELEGLYIDMYVIIVTFIWIKWTILVDWKKSINSNLLPSLQLALKCLNFTFYFMPIVRQNNHIIYQE